MGKAINWVRGEIWTGFSKFERMFLIFMLLLQIAVFIIVPDTTISIISGISGVVSVVLCAKGKISFYYIGFVQTLSYLWLAWEARFYGEVMENIFYLVTMVMGIFMWKKRMRKNEDGTTQVDALKFSAKQWIWSILATIAATAALGFGLQQIGSQQAYTDAATNIFAIFAQILMIKRYREQWVWWLAIDLLCIKLWAVDGNWTMVAMYIAWTINCIYGWFNWTKLNKAVKN